MYFSLCRKVTSETESWPIQNWSTRCGGGPLAALAFRNSPRLTLSIRGAARAIANPSFGRQTIDKIAAVTSARLQTKRRQSLLRKSVKCVCAPPTQSERDRDRAVAGFRYSWSRRNGVPDTTDYLSCIRDYAQGKVPFAKTPNIVAFREHME